MKFSEKVAKYYIRSANGATIDLVDSEPQARKIAKDNHAQVWMLRGGKLVRI
jgi:hypothetical protein